MDAKVGELTEGQTMKKRPIRGEADRPCHDVEGRQAAMSSAGIGLAFLLVPMRFT